MDGARCLLFVMSVGSGHLVFGHDLVLDVGLWTTLKNLKIILKFVLNIMD